MGRRSEKIRDVVAWDRAAARQSRGRAGRQLVDIDIERASFLAALSRVRSASVVRVTFSAETRPLFMPLAGVFGTLLHSAMTLTAFADRQPRTPAVARGEGRLR